MVMKNKECNVGYNKIVGMCATCNIGQLVIWEHSILKYIAK